ncbi:hypothetical protein L1987_13273 [Smallanthus sonchifolius]|uniref:Uncharacterized protein n=1 Tax=Smallanthus sonchifolius TaxID=185202 RepID=A0ACB9JH26_9ASTR|nr:hypothetical protein L1987_13273 [Smallanthus sonchifolius]
MLLLDGYGAYGRAPLVERAPSNVDREENFTFEPQVQVALARENNGILKSSLPAMLVDALKKVNDGIVGNSGFGPAMDDESDEEYAGGPGYGCSYKGFCDCDPPILLPPLLGSNVWRLPST